eukprot:CAMPEP_0177218202 /NCGR_PEP_ID=MMETSP0367-20130122/35691_1 /TAXON_ID=447022 ORGANISM="Scrippsiella hangoei-like, Strain SHHI-4" /NCGR_SAMPLE_ID=MMETSP0367 /ASSEMBLY_ACC=CAM_ASM_000362 /LENGTH=59 /DNA_ID=CAMNT_0018667821 /DNA_START=13 /DNA_END=192 /DNA_ORIENTATION=-
MPADVGAPLPEALERALRQAHSTVLSISLVYFNARQLAYRVLFTQALPSLLYHSGPLQF